MRQAGIILCAFALCCIFSENAYGRGRVAFPGSHRRTIPSNEHRYGCTSVVGDYESKQLVVDIRPYCVGDVRRIFIRKRDRFIPFNDARDSEEYYDVCCLPKGSRYQHPRWR